MKLNWFSPLPPARSGISDYLWHVLPSLAERASLTLWTNQDDWDSALERYATVKKYHGIDEFWRQVNQAEMTIYHVGNNPVFHGEIWELSTHHPGVIVLHDVALQHLFIEVFIQYHHDIAGYLASMERFYGKRGRRAAQRLIDHECTPEDLCQHFPLTLLATERALGVLIHNQDGFDALSSHGRWPVAWSGLPYKPSEESRQLRELSAKDVCRLIVFGHLGRNRRLEPLLKALAGLAERERFRLDIYGEVWNASYVHQLRDSLGLANQVELHGFVPDSELKEALSRADLAINLRFPTVGETSLSQLLIWEHALPTLVTKAGWYSELPNDAVAMVRMEHETADLQHHLSQVLKDPAHYVRIGQRGRQLLDSHHAPDRYARVLLDLAGRAVEFRSRASAFQLARKVGEELTLWSGAEGESSAKARAAEALLAMFSNQGLGE